LGASAAVVVVLGARAGVATAAAAADSASDPAYAAESGGAWKGQYDVADPEQNPPGTDNGGTGLGVWDFSGGYYDSQRNAPYGRLNHFIDGVDFPHSTYNNLGGPAFGLTNFDGLFATTTATRPFATPMSVGDTLSVKFDTPATYNTSGSANDVYPFVIITLTDALGQKTFDIEAGKNAAFGEFPWSYDDATGTDVDTGIDPDATSDGSALRFQLTGPTTGVLAFDFGGPDQQVIPISLLNGPPSKISFTLYSANTSSNNTGEYEFFFNDLAIAAPPDNEWQKPVGGNNDGNWGDAGQWKNGVVPDGVDATASFLSHPSLDGNLTVTLETPRTVGTINFDNVSRSYTLSGGVGGNGITLDVSSGEAHVNVTSGSHVIDAPLTLADDTTVTVSPANAALSISSIQASAAATTKLTKVGAGTLRLTGVNAYGGTTTISGGVLNAAALANINTPSSIGTGSTAGSAADLVIDGGTLEYTGSTDQSTDRPFTIGVGASAATLDSSGIGAMRFTATGVIATTGTGPRTLTLAGSSTAANTLAPALADEGANATSLVKSGPGTWTIGGGAAASSYSGNTTITAGTLKYGANDTVPSGAGKGNVVVTGTLDLNGFSGTVNGLSGSGVVTNSGPTPTAITVGANDQTGTFTGTLSNTGASLALTKTGTGALTLAGVNSYSGNTAVNAGTLKYGVNNAIPSDIAAGNVAVDATLDLAGFSGTINGLSGSGTVTNSAATASTITIGANGQTSTFAGALSNGSASLSVVKSGAGILTLAGVNTYSGSTTVSAGTLRYGVNSTIPSGSGKGNVIVNGTLDLNAFSGTLNGLSGSGAVTNSASSPSTITVGANNQTSTFAGTLGNAGAALSLVKAGTGALTLSGVSAYGGSTTVSAGTLKYGVNQALPSGPTAGNVTVSGILDLGGFNGDLNGLSGSGTVTNSGGTASNVNVGANAATTTFAGTIANSGAALSVSKVGTGTLTLSGANTYSGNTTVSVGTLKYGANSTLPSGSGKGNVTVNATLDMAGFNGGINGLSGTGIVTNTGGTASNLSVGATSQTSTFAGSLTNTGASLSLTKIGAGTLTLAGGGGGANSYTGDTTVSVGTLRYGVNEAIPSGAGRGNVTVNATLDLGGSSGTVNGLSGSGMVTNSGVGASIITAGANNQTSTFSGTLSNPGNSLSIVKTGTGTLTLGGANTHSGGTTVANGTLILANADALAGGPIDVADGALVRAQASLPKAVALAALTANTTGTFDITNNALVVRDMTVAQVQTLVRAGYNVGHWNGASGLVSTTAESASPATTAIGVANAGTLQKTTFEGVTNLTGAETLVKYTYYGDSDLSGGTTLDDFTLFLGGYQRGGSTWLQGDYDYSGQVTLDDLTLFLRGYQQQGVSLSQIEALIASVPMGAAERAAMLAAVQAVPEPTAAGTWLMASIGGRLLARRRRRRPAQSRVSG
jgi:autotransporter-associated beta strand protein